MKLEVVKNAVTSKVGRQILIGKKHSPVILFAGGVVGVVVTTVLASRATLKLDYILEEATYEHKMVDSKNYRYHRTAESTRRLDHLHVNIVTAAKITKLYSPAIVVGSVSIAALTGSHVILSNRNTALMAAYSALDKGFNEYRKRVQDEYGEEKELELRHGYKTKEVEVHDTKKGTVKKTKVNVMPGSPSVYARFFDELSPNWTRNPEYNLIFLKAQQSYLNDLLHSRGHVFLNEAYDALGIERSQAGAVVGWIVSKDGDNYIDFGVYDESNERVRDFVNGLEPSILLDFNVDGVIYDKI